MSATEAKDSVQTADKHCVHRPQPTPLSSTPPLQSLWQSWRRRTPPWIEISVARPGISPTPMAIASIQRPESKTRTGKLSNRGRTSSMVRLCSICVVQFLSVFHVETVTSCELHALPFCYTWYDIMHTSKLGTAVCTVACIAPCTTASLAGVPQQPHV